LGSVCWSPDLAGAHDVASNPVCMVTRPLVRFREPPVLKACLAGTQSGEGCSTVRSLGFRVDGPPRLQLPRLVPLGSPHPSSGPRGGGSTWMSWGSNLASCSNGTLAATHPRQTATDYRTSVLLGPTSWVCGSPDLAGGHDVASNLVCRATRLLMRFRNPVSTTCLC
jgi:hypothetical protein